MTSKLTKLSKNILQGLFTIVDLDSRELTNSKHKPAPIFQPVYPYLLSDPRITFIKRILELILPPHPASFRLKNLRDWLVNTPLSIFLTQLSWHCKTDCIFCYQKGNPPFMRGKRRSSDEEVATRLKYFDPEKSVGLPCGDILENDEVLTNPHICNVLETIRKKNQTETIEILTNGTSLTPKMVSFLGQAKPLLLVVSLNSADPVERRQLMRDPHPEIAINSLPLLKKQRLPYITSIVVWPGLAFSDMEKTIAYAQKNQSLLVCFCMPGYSKFFSGKKLFDAKETWTCVTRYFHHKAKDYQIPLLFTPQIFEQNLLYPRVDLPLVVGCVINSPAARSNIQPGDLILSVNDQPVDSISGALTLLNKYLNSTIKLKIKRQGKVFALKLKDRACYPYVNTATIKRTVSFGLVLPSVSIRHDDILDIGRHLLCHQANNILIVTSVRAKPIIQYLVKKYAIGKAENAKIHIITCKNYFYGGSIDSANLLSVADIIHCVKAYLKKAQKPDLIILPVSPFTKWGRDCTGQVNLDIERAVDIPVEFIYNISR